MGVRRLIIIFESINKAYMICVHSALCHALFSLQDSVGLPFYFVIIGPLSGFFLSLHLEELLEMVSK